MTSALNAATSARTAAGVIAVTRPAPERSAARDARAAAPAIPGSRHDEDVAERPLVGVARAARQEAGEVLAVEGPGCRLDRGHGLGGMPMSATSTVPASAQAGGSTWASLGRHRATELWAAITGPGISALSPESRTEDRPRGPGRPRRRRPR
jgi:hypothetical protein